MTRTHRLISSAALAAALIPSPAFAQQSTLGYYRFPAIAGDSVVFTAEGDLWRVPIAGGTAQRLTSHPAEESHAAVSPDGKTVAFSASYEGPTEVYTLSLDTPAPPVRLTWEGGNATVVGWTPQGEVLYSTRRYSTLPNTQLARVNPKTRAVTLVPLAQASDGAYDGSTLFFTRFPFQGSYTKRYHGGTAQSIWKFDGSGEAADLTADYTGTSKTPMVWQGRVYFLSDRDGTINIWSMDTSGKNLRQHTRHAGGFDVQSPALANGRIVYQLGADLHVFDIAANRDAPLSIRLVSDFDQMRDRWVRTPGDWISTAHVSPNGDRVVFTARGQLFVVPAQQGRIVEATRDRKTRFREGRFFPDGKTLLTLSDKTGEVEFWRVPANGIGEPEQLTRDAKVLRWDGVPSPDGKHIAHWDKDQELWVYDVSTKVQTKLASSSTGDFQDIEWSPDSRWLAYSAPVENQVNVLYVYNSESHAITPVTTARYESYSPAWTPDGKWLYFLSNRTFTSLVQSPWGSRQPEPFFDKQTKIYQIALKRDERSPFQPDDELHGRTDDKKSDASAGKPDGGSGKPDAGSGKPEPVKVDIDLDGIQSRLLEVPLPAGNYSDLATDGKRLYYVSSEPGDNKRTLKTMAIDNKRGTAPDTFMEDIGAYELTLDGKKLMFRKGSDYFVVDAGAKAPAAAELGKSQVALRDWTFDLDPRDEWRQMFMDAWRLERDYFYDRGMNGVNWPSMRDRFLPLVDRVTDRAELNDILAQMVGELSALHIFVRGGDVRRGQDQVTHGSLGATFTRDEAAGGFKVAHIYRTDPDNPAALSPLARQGVKVEEGDVIEAVNGIPALSSPDLGGLLRNEADRQVLLRVKPKAGGSRDVIVVPVPVARETAMRYDEWEYTRRLQVEKASKSRIGYVHLRAMGPGDMAQWAREFYPVFDREGLIIDVRHNNGGNIDSWLLEKLLRKAWFFWQPRVGSPTWNMQYAFRGHIVVLTDENTASDGEAFAEGFRRLGLGKVIGTRTWGGEIWLSSSNFLVDRGIATAAEMGVFGPEGQWLIEGHGVDPDIVVDNLPHATFEGKDAQLDAALAELEAEIKAHPIPAPKTPAYPKKGGGSN